MTLQRPLPRSLVRVPRSQQNGFILVVTLICLVLMLVASIALLPPAISCVVSRCRKALVAGASRLTCATR